MKKNDFLVQYFEKRKSKILKFFLFFLLIFFLIFIINNSSTSKNFIGKIHLEGIINDKNELIKQLNDISKNKNIKGLLIIINSPGGTFVSSKEIFDALEKISMKIPTSAYMREMGTSGAYLASLGVKKISAPSAQDYQKKFPRLRRESIKKVSERLCRKNTQICLRAFGVSFFSNS